MINIQKTLLRLAEKRPIFHSEADFQHSFAWEIHHLWPKSSMRLEYRPPNFKNRVYIDVWAKYNNYLFAIELKYKTIGLSATFPEESFDLLNQSAQDIGRYDFLKDVQRLEQVTLNHHNIIGYSILLTNDNTYWQLPRNNLTVDAAFRVHQDRVVTGKLHWKSKTSKGTMYGREMPIIIKNIYKLNWKDYSEVSNKACGKFRYLLVKVEKRRVGGAEGR